eukprot:gene3079-2061_t
MEFTTFAAKSELMPQPAKLQQKPNHQHEITQASRVNIAYTRSLKLSHHKSNYNYKKQTYASIQNSNPSTPTHVKPTHVKKPNKHHMLYAHLHSPPNTSTSKQHFKITINKTSKHHTHQRSQSTLNPTYTIKCETIGQTYPTSSYQSKHDYHTSTTPYPNHKSIGNPTQSHHLEVHRNTYTCKHLPSACQSIPVQSMNLKRPLIQLKEPISKPTNQHQLSATNN